MPSRNINDCHPSLQHMIHDFLGECRMKHIDVLITCTYRSQQEQDALYEQGRTTPGRIVTWTRVSQHCATMSDGSPGSRAFDVVPLRHGVLVWGTHGNGLDNDPSDDETDDLELWERVGQIGRSVGLEWGGDWPDDKTDRPHFQMRA